MKLTTCASCALAVAVRMFSQAPPPILSVQTSPHNGQEEVKRPDTQASGQKDRDRAAIERSSCGDLERQRCSRSR
jgi:hypothetical protein